MYYHHCLDMHTFSFHHAPDSFTLLPAFVFFSVVSACFLYKTWSALLDEMMMIMMMSMMMMMMSMMMMMMMCKRKRESHKFFL